MPGAEDLYTIGQWKGLPRYQCNVCAFDTLHEDVIIEHVTQAHMAPPVQTRVVPGIVDRFGNPVIIEEEVTDGESIAHEVDR